MLKSLFIDSEFRGGKIQPLSKISFHLTQNFEGNFRVFETIPLLNIFFAPFFQPALGNLGEIAFFLVCFLQDSVIALMKSAFLIFCGTKIEERQKLIFLKTDNSGIFEKERALVIMASARFVLF